MSVLARRGAEPVRPSGAAAPGARAAAGHRAAGLRAPAALSEPAVYRRRRRPGLARRSRTSWNV